MTLKNSFLTDALENFKRRNWVFWISFLAFFCYFPGFLILNLNNYRSQMEYSYSDPERIMTRMQNSVQKIFEMNRFLPFLIICIAILIGIQAFAYLHDKKQVNFYHSQPVSRNRRFLVIWFNGIMIFLVTYLVNMLLGIAVAGAYECRTGVIWKAAMEGFLLYFLLFLGIYHIAVIAVMLTGHALVSILAMGVLLGYEVAARGLMTLYASSFFDTYSDHDAVKIFDTLLSPIVTYYKYITYKGSDYPWQQDFASYPRTALSLLGMALLFGIISWFLYSKRPSESHGKSISFTKIKEPLKVLMLLIIGSYGAIIIYAVAGGSVPLGIVGAIFFTFLGHDVIQLIYEVDFRAMTKKIPTMVISAVAVVLIFLSFKFDFFKYDQYIPKQSKVKSVSVKFNSVFYENIRIFPDGSEINAPEYARNMMQITELDSVYEVLANVADIDELTGDNGLAGTAGLQRMHIVFRMNNGKIVNRSYWLNYEENLEAINKIYRMDEFQRSYNQVLEEDFASDYNIYTAYYNNGVHTTEVFSHTVKPLIEAYCKDVQAAHYKEIYNVIPVGKITFGGRGLVDPEFINQWEVVIYPSFTNTIEILKQQGISWKSSLDEEYKNAITELTVYYTDEDAWIAADYNGNYSDYRKIITYTDKEDIEAIVQNSVSHQNVYWNAGGTIHESDYDIEVGISNENGELSYTETLTFPTGQIPEFILQDMAQMEFGSETTK